MQLPKETIKEIAENLNCGFVIHIHKKTNAIIQFLDVDPDEFYSNTGEIQEGQKEVKDNYSDYLKIEKMSSKLAFSIMEAFINEVEDIRIRVKLMDALEKRSPFQHFKYELGYHEEIRQQWFKFKGKKYIEYVEAELFRLEGE